MTHAEYLKNVGIEFKVARIRKAMTREDIAKITGMSTQSIMSIENGKSDSHLLTYKRIADALEVSLKDIL